LSLERILRPEVWICYCKKWQFIKTLGKLFVSGIKQQVVDMILSYNTLWLRIGLEVSYP